jgi:sugar phosphate isomerase/epimerase
MNLSVSTASFGRAFAEKKLTLLDFPELCDRHGLDAIELNDFYLKGDWNLIREIKRRAVKYGLGVCAVAVENNYYRATEAEIEREQDHIAAYLDVAYFLGAPILRVDTCPYGKDYPDRIIPRGVTHEMAFDRAVATFRKVVPEAAEKGIVLALENHGGISRTSADQLKIIHAVNSEWLRINLDTGNYHADPVNALHPFENVLEAIPRVAPFLAFCHAKIWDVTDDLHEPTLDYERIFKLFTEHKYCGPVSIEYQGKKDALDMLPRCVLMLKRWRAQALHS